MFFHILDLILKVFIVESINSEDPEHPEKVNHHHSKEKQTSGYS